MQAITVRTYMGFLLTSLNLAVRHKLLPTNPGKNVRKVKVSEPETKYLPKVQVELLLQHQEGIPDWLVQPFLFSCHTGLRLSDIETLVWGEVHGNGVTSEGRQQFRLVKKQLKTENVMQVPLTTQAVAILNALGLRSKAASDALAPVFKLKSRSQAKRLVARWREQTGVFFTYHSSRHTFGTTLQTAGVDIYTTSRLMGHRSIHTTTRYAKVVCLQSLRSQGRLDGFCFE